MNWLLILVVLLIAGNMVWGFFHGFVRVIYSMLGWVLVLFLTIWATPQLSNWLEKSAYVQGTLKSIFAAFVISLIVWKLLLQFVIKALDLIAKLPLLREVNGFMGILAGLAKGLFVTELILLVVSLGSETAFGTTMGKMIAEAPLLTWLCRHNILLDIVKTLI